MKKPDHIKDYKGYKGTWAANIRMFDQKKSKPAKKVRRAHPIRTKGTDKVSDLEMNLARQAVDGLNAEVREANSEKPIRTMHIK